MKEIVTFEDWGKTLFEPFIMLLITRKTCQDCVEVEKYLESNNHLINQIPVRKISLDNSDSENLINNLEWIKKEVDVIPFWVLMNYEKRLSTVRGGIKEARDLTTFSRVNLFQED
ncbi:MAG TPA: hypothetical protein HA240_02805 [Candidatus Thalassarchaeaceae archaeon]|jgi:hypothetical protein|nr:MAG TPA: hypothetical protein D7I04_02795 [Candidatus Poseidoniales archaeon]HIH06160.1 hypothetical protein [Candidatus Thalassarchaeaceae archaeon]